MSFQDVVSNFVCGVYVVGSAFEGKLNAMTAAWVSQVSLSPTMIMVAISPNRYTYQLIKGAKMFSICQLCDDQLDLARDFGRDSGTVRNKFENIDYEIVEGMPVLRECLLWMICDVYNIYEAGDHMIVVGKIRKAKKLSNKPALIFRWEDYF